MKPLNRRTFLRGTGTALALPLLEAMAPVGKTAFAAGGAPARMLAWYLPCGIHMPAWRPAGTGANYALSPTLEPLANVKDQLMVISGLENVPGYSMGGGDHSSGTASFLTAVQAAKPGVSGGVSIDQIAAQQLGERTRIDSLALGIEGGDGGNCGGESGYNGAYLCNVSWKGPQTRKPKETDPARLFNTLTAGFDPNAATEAALRRKQMDESVLNAVQDDAKNLYGQLGMEDRVRMQEYEHSIRDLEIRLNNVDTGGEECTLEQPVVGSGREGHIKAMCDLQVLAFQCDITRIQTFMLASGGTYTTYGFLPGVNQGHHTLSHTNNFDAIKTIDRWEISMFAYLLEKLNNTKDPSGNSLLESCACLLSNEISDGNRHNHDDLPVLLAGSCNGYFATGQHADLGKARYSNLLYSMLDAFGAQVDGVGDSNGFLNAIRT